MIIYEYNKHSLGSRPDKKRRRPRTIRLPLPNRVALIVPAALVVLAICGYGALKIFESQKAANTNQAPVSNKQLSSFKNIFLSSADTQAGQSIEVSLVAPKSWPVKQVEFPASDLLGENNLGVLKVQFEGSQNKVGGSVYVENVANWLVTDGQPGAFGGLVKPGDKQKAFKALDDSRLNRSVKDLNWSTLFSAPEQIGGVQNPVYVNSADGKLAGIVYATIISTDNSYRPHVVAYMSGTIGGHPILLRAQFALENQTYRELYSLAPHPESVQQAISDYKSGQIDREDSEMIKHVADLLRSLSFDSGGL